MAQFKDAVIGATGDVHTEARNEVMTVAVDTLGREWLYMQGVANLVAGDAVTYDEAGVTTLLAASAIGPVAIAGAAIDATTEFGWFCIKALSGVAANGVASIADNSRVGRETTDGKLGDGRAAGDEIYNMVARNATTGAGALTVQMCYPFVDDVNGA